MRALETTRLQAVEGNLWLLEGAEATIEDGVVTLARGNAVIDGQRLSVAVDDVIVEGVGAFRVDAGVAPRVAVYAGSAEVRRPGEGYRLTPFRQISLLSRRFDGLDEPLTYDDEDPLDQLLLSKAINFDQEVARYSTRLTELYGTELRPASFYSSFVEVADEEVEVLTAAAPTRDESGAVGPPAEALIGLFIARALSDGDLESLQAAANRVAALRREGARWGLVAMALDLVEVTFGATIDQAVAARAVAVAAPAPAPVAGPAAVPPVTSGPPTAPGDPVANPPAPPAPPEPPPEIPTPGGNSLLPAPVETLLEEVLDIVPAVTDLLLN